MLCVCMSSKTFETEILLLPAGSENLGCTRNECKLQNREFTIGLLQPTTPYFVLAQGKQGEAGQCQHHEITLQSQLVRKVSEGTAGP